MSKELWIQYLSIFIAIVAMIIARKELKRFIPVGLFASLYANLVCYVANYFEWWDFPVRFLHGVKDISFTANVVVIPVLAMFWVRYSPMSRIKWTLLWTTILTGIEYLTERYTGMIAYHNGYNWYHSYILWLISWYIWCSFHKWFYKDGNLTNKFHSFPNRFTVRLHGLPPFNILSGYQAGN